MSYSIEEETQEEDKLNKISALRDGLYAFVRYDGILDNRFKRSEKDHRARLDERHYDRSTVVDEGACILRDHQTQLHNLIIDVGVAYGEDWSWLYKEKFGFDSEGEQQQQVYERKIEELGQRIGELIRQDNGQKALEVIQQARAKDACARHVPPPRPVCNTGRACPASPAYRSTQCSL